MKLIAEASVFKENIKSCFVINRKIANTAIGRDVREALAAYDIPTLKTAITQRVIFAEAAASGKALHEVDATSQAVTEIENLINELLEIMK